MLRDGLRALSESLLSTSSGGSSSEKLTLGDVGEPPPGSPPQRRRCRDVACLAFFALYWVGMLLVSAQAYYEGDLRRLYSGYDSDDNLCGIDDSVRHAPFVYFPCLQYGGRHPTVCMPRCPAISAHYVRWYNGSQIMCPTASRSLHKIPATTYPTANLLHNCVPGAPSLYAVVADRIDQSAFTSVLAGLFRAWHVVLLAAAAAAALALLWAACIRAMCRARAMAVSTVLVAVASLALLAAALWVRAFYLSSAAFADEHPIFLGSLEVAINTDMSLVLALVTTVFAVSVAVALWCGLLHRLLEGGGIIAEAAEAVAAMPALLLVIPPVVSVLLVGLFFFWGYVALLIATAGTPIKGELAYDRPLQWLLILHAAGVLWSAEALLHVGCCATSAVVVRWCAPRNFSAAQIRPRNSAAQLSAPPHHASRLCRYFASIDCAAPLGSRRTVAALGRAAGKCLRYSSGSVVLGAVLMIPGRIFRFFLEHCLHQTQARDLTAMRHLSAHHGLPSRSSLTSHYPPCRSTRRGSPSSAGSRSAACAAASTAARGGSSTRRTTRTCCSPSTTCRSAREPARPSSSRCVTSDASPSSPPVSGCCLRWRSSRWRA